MAKAMVEGWGGSRAKAFAFKAVVGSSGQDVELPPHLLMAASQNLLPEEGSKSEKGQVSQSTTLQ